MGATLRQRLRENRFLLRLFLGLLVLAVLAVFLLQRAQAASPSELTNRLLLFLLWYLDVSLIVVLLFILVRDLVRLAASWRRGVLGSRFRTKLVLTYVVLSFVPVIFIFLVATNLFQRSIDRWFSAPVEEVLQGGAALAEQARSLAEERLEDQARVAAERLSSEHGPEGLPELRALLGADLLAVYQNGRRLQAVTDPRRISGSLPQLPSSEVNVMGHRADRWRGGLLVRSWRPIPGPAEHVVVVGAMLPPRVLSHLERASAAYANFQQMKLHRRTITGTTVLVFLAVTLVLLFATVWTGLYLSRRFTSPLGAVVSATQRVAEGDQLEEVQVPARDEMAVLVSSFNAMVRRVRATEAKILASNQELATLLATVPTGVLTIDGHQQRVKANPAASRLLELGGDFDGWHPFSMLDKPGLEPLVDLLTQDLGPRGQHHVDLEVEGRVRHLEVSGRPLPGGGWVVALEDLTQLVHAQRSAAWSEVARQIAHEIKNPLTPIRLAAERVARHGRRIQDETIRGVVQEGCSAIVDHVAGLKELVGAFHEYARMPSVTPEQTALEPVLRGVVELFRDVRSGVDVRLEWEGGGLEAHVDAALLRQALVNLMDNAVESIRDRGEVALCGRRTDESLILEVRDSGAGLPTTDTGVLTRPFFSTKGRGSGMGLALVHRIVADHGGSLELGARDGGGTVARITVPLAGPGPRNRGGRENGQGIDPDRG